MITKEQSEKSDEVMREVFQNQFQELTGQVLTNLSESSKFREKLATKLLLIMGSILLVGSLLMKIDYPFKIASLSEIEFTALIFSSSGLLFVGALFSLLQAWSWRSIIRAQQVVGMEILHKQIDTEKELRTGKNRYQAGGELILLPTKIRKLHRR
jgi:hypothetical protein